MWCLVTVWWKGREVGKSKQVYESLSGQDASLVECCSGFAGVEMWWWWVIIIVVVLLLLHARELSTDGNVVQHGSHNNYLAGLLGGKAQATAALAY